MRIRMRALTAALAVGAAMASPLVAQAQVRQGDQDRLRDRLHQMDQQIQRMDRIRDRIHQLDRQLGQQMDRVQQQIRQRDEEHARAQAQLRNEAQRKQGDQVRDQQRLREQEQLRQHQQVREMNWALADMAQYTHRNMERTRAMAGDPVFGGDPELQREMEQLEANWRIMGDELEKGLQSMERMRQRLSSAIVATR